MAGAGESCSSQGFICRAACKELVRCTPNGNGTFAEQVVRRCQGTIGHFCNASDLGCSGDSCQDAGLDVVKLTCHENGTYPNPTDCTKYFNCTNGVLREFVCPSNSSYNAAVRNCSASLLARSCVDRPIPKCQSVSDIGGYSEDPAVFYVCAYDDNGYLRPELHRCSSGFAFDLSNGRCEVITNNGASVRSLNTSAAVLLFVILCLSRLFEK